MPAFNTVLVYLTYMLAGFGLLAGFVLVYSMVTEQWPIFCQVLCSGFR
jgi:hypothetical protein